jgi:hypothetical protein
MGADSPATTIIFSPASLFPFVVLIVRTALSMPVNYSCEVTERFAKPERGFARDPGSFGMERCLGAHLDRRV